MYGAVAAYTHSPTVDDVLGVSISSLGVTNKKAKQSGNFYFMKDIQGSVTAITDSNGVVKQRYRYSSFGKVIKIDDDSGNSIILDRFIDNQFAYTGREYDTESGMYYYRARYFDPTIGRFLQQDPDPGKVEKPISFVNKYIYADNSPIMMRDPSGRSSIWGWVMAAMAPITSLILMNTTNFFQSNFDFTAGDIKAVNFAAVTVAIIGLSIITGGAAGAAVGGGWAGAGVGAAVGAITGAAVGAIGFPALGLGSAKQGAMYGAIVGGIAGGIAGYMASPIPKIAELSDCLWAGAGLVATGGMAAATLAMPLAFPLTFYAGAKGAAMYALYSPDCELYNKAPATTTAGL